MALTINTNLMAANSARSLNSHYNKLATSTQRLSSGLRVNSAADDAAGLAVREMMRSDIATLGQGIRNANDAISMIQTADGALAVIDEKLIRMKELAEQASTGTYNSVQRMIIDSEFQAMASEIDRIANSTDFNGIKLLDGSMGGVHDGSGINSRGAAKIHFGTGNDSAEDYYYVDIPDMRVNSLFALTEKDPITTGARPLWATMPINDFSFAAAYPAFYSNKNFLLPIDNVIIRKNTWGGLLDGGANETCMFVIPRGIKNLVINTFGTSQASPGVASQGDNDIQLFTKNGMHLAGTPLEDYVWKGPTLSHVTGPRSDTSLATNCGRMGFTLSDYDDSMLNKGSSRYDVSGNIGKYSTYNGMNIWYSGDGERVDSRPNDGAVDDYDDYETLAIDEVTEDLVFYFPGFKPGAIKATWGAIPTTTQTIHRGTFDIQTQERAQRMLGRIDRAIEIKDTTRAHLGALQNRLENTVTNLQTQAENLQASESRISDTDVATEMTYFVRQQILTQGAVAMLSQANSLPKMAMNIIGG